MKTLFVLAACTLIGSTSPTAKEDVTVRVAPRISMAPATIRVVVTVEPDTENRELEVAADSGEFFTSSTIQLDGTNAPRQQWLELKELPAGDYEVQALVRRRMGPGAKAVTEYMVLGSDR